MQDSDFLRRAIRLAMDGRGHVEPNPMVGCVIARDGRVIGEGIHARYGQAHAEPGALADCEESPAGATAYVTLEPCCHTNKQTPPCVPRLIGAGIARVVVGCIDPNPDVNGKGIAMLRNAGIIVDRAEPALHAECMQLIAAFIKRRRFDLPYVTLKWAESSDGKVAGTGGHRLRISNDLSMRLVHQLRARSEAIATGTNTVIRDDPLLTARGFTRSGRAIRVVLSNSLNIPPTHRLVRTAHETPVVVYTSDARSPASFESLELLREAGVEVVELPAHGEPRFRLVDFLTDIGHRHVNHVLIETGPILARSFLAGGLADRVWVFRCPSPIVEPDAPLSEPVDYPASGRIDVAGDTLTEYLNPAGCAYFAPTPSADFVLAEQYLNDIEPRMDADERR